MLSLRAVYPFSRHTKDAFVALDWMSIEDAGAGRIFGWGCGWWCSIWMGR
jgi:hypothetical protein